MIHADLLKQVARVAMSFVLRGAERISTGPLGGVRTYNVMFGLALHFHCIGSTHKHCVEMGNNGKILIDFLWCCPIGFIAVSVAFWAFLEGFI